MIEEVFAEIATHAAKGLSIHKHLIMMFGFLNLTGYEELQKYRYFEESRDYIKLHSFFLSHFNKMIKENSVEETDIIPSNWFKFTKQEVDANNKRSAIKDLMKKWIDWEKETKVLLETNYKKLYEVGEIEGALFIGEFIREVGDELAFAQEQQINLDSIGYDLVYIVDQQEELYKHYNKKIKRG